MPRPTAAPKKVVKLCVDKEKSDEEKRLLEKRKQDDVEIEDEEEEEDEESEEESDCGIVDEPTALQASEDGLALLRDGKYEEATELFSHALRVLSSLYSETSPKLAPTFLRYGLCLLREHQAKDNLFNPASNLMQKAKAADAAANDSEDPAAQDYDGLVLAYGILATAKAGFTEACDKPMLVETHNALGETLHEMANFEAAAGEYGTAVDLLKETVSKDDPAIGIAYSCQAMAYRFAYNMDLAKEACQKALDVFLADPVANEDRLQCTRELLEDCSLQNEERDEIIADAKDATVGTHNVAVTRQVPAATTNGASSSSAVKILQPKKKSKLAK
eukprot:TRINITY_DN8065_c2_g1_i1.p1 TRINITY_DN8065_c2_g1~~TRINITY_DN8065_c2_g1_i1.p1  ORF type:complete len:343 (+),score=96.34 TRINITY_DN8065_c2_g1_i1:35-1030(+)